MDFNRLTQKFQEATEQAQTKALRYGHVEIDGEHLLLALLEQSDGLVPRLLARMEISLDPLVQAVEHELQRRPSTSGSGVEVGKDLCHPASAKADAPGGRRGQASQRRVRLG